jgi:protein SCO1/2
VRSRLAVLLLVALALTGCSSSSASEFTGAVLHRPYHAADTRLTDTEGHAFSLASSTDHRLTLVFFGYTHCPDECPTTMAMLASAMLQLDSADRDNVQVVFVTTDPARDTPSELGKWLKGIDTQFVGLTGDFATIQAGARSIGISIEPTSKDKNGKLVSVHGTQVVAFSPKTNGGYLLYGQDTTVDDYTKDLPKIVKGETP